MSVDADQPRSVEFWDNLYKEGRLPWDCGGVPERLRRFIELENGEGRVAGKSVLIPGCGSAYEAAYLASRGMQVTAIDVSEPAIERARSIVGDLPVRFEVSDFFELVQNDFDFVYERAFLCAIHPSFRDRFPAVLRSLLKDDGKLFGFFFVDTERKSGPPYPITEVNLSTLMTGLFQQEADESTEDQLAVFEGKERWQVWSKVL